MIMKIISEKIFKAHLVCAEEKMVKGYGLLSVAWYELNGMEKWNYKIEFWNRHAPVDITVKLVQVDLEKPYVYINPFGVPMVNEDCSIIYSDDLLFACPVTKEGSYMAGYDPLTLAQRYVNKHMRPMCRYRQQSDEFIRVVK